MMNEQIAQFLQWERATRDTIDVKKIYIDMSDDLVAGVLLSQIVYWHLPSKMDSTKLRVQKEGLLWLVKGRDDWWDECRIKPRQFDTAMDKLLELQLVEKKKFKFDGSPMIHIRIVWDKFLQCFQEQLKKNDYGGESLVPHGFHDSVKSNSQPESLDATGFNGSVKWNSQHREMDLPESVKSLTQTTAEITLIDRMSADETAAASDFDPVYESLLEHVPKYCYVHGVPLGRGYIDEIYIMLTNQFSGKLEPAVVEIACELYFERACSIGDSGAIVMKLDIDNPTGFFNHCYTEALKRFKLTRNRRASGS